jgi:hypothetical protein
MKNTLASLILCTLFAAATSFATPQQPLSPQPPPAQSLRNRLALTADQQRQFRAINRERKEQLAAVQADTSLSPHTRRQKIKDIHLDAEARIHAMLNENQQAEYDQIKRERREKAERDRQTALPPQ